MGSIIVILGTVFFLAVLAYRLNKKEDEVVNHPYDEVVADMYNTHNTEEMKQDNDAPKSDTPKPGLNRNNGEPTSSLSLSRTEKGL